MIGIKFRVSLVLGAGEITHLGSIHRGFWHKLMFYLLAWVMTTWVLLLLSLYKLNYVLINCSAYRVCFTIFKRLKKILKSALFVLLSYQPRDVWVRKKKKRGTSLVPFCLFFSSRHKTDNMDVSVPKGTDMPCGVPRVRTRINGGCYQKSILQSMFGGTYLFSILFVI